MPSDNAVPWKIRDLFFALGAMLAGILLLNGGILLLNQIAGGNLRENRDALTLTLIPQQLIIFGAAYYFSITRYRATFAQLGVRAFNAPRGCGLSAALLLASYAFRFCYVAAALALGVRLGAQEIVSALSISGVGLCLTFIVAGVAAPIAEEIFFRGFFYGGLRSAFGIAPALLASAVVFTALHFTLELFLPIFVLGIFLAWLYEKTGSLIPGILLHSANNSIAVIALVLAQALGIPSG